MEEIVKYIVGKLVKNTESVLISSTEDAGKVTITVKVDKEDMGKVIGKNGKVADSIRAIVKTASNGTQKHYFVKFEENQQN